jgi:hypothetical protein
MNWILPLKFFLVAIGVWRGVAMDYLKFYWGPPTLVRSEGRPPLKRWPIYTHTPLKWPQVPFGSILIHWYTKLYEA